MPLPEPVARKFIEFARRRQKNRSKVSLPLSLVRDFHTQERRGYFIFRDLEYVDKEFKSYKLTALTDLINNKLISNKGKRVNVLDVGADDGNLGLSLAKMNDLFGRPF